MESNRPNVEADYAEKDVGTPCVEAVCPEKSWDPTKLSWVRGPVYKHMALTNICPATQASCRHCRVYLYI